MTNITFDHFTQFIYMLFESVLGLIRREVGVIWLLMREGIDIRDRYKFGDRGGVGAKVGGGGVS